MNKRLIKLWNRYQKAMWYVQVTGTEIGKPLRFYSETALLLLLLDKFGLSLTPLQFIIIYSVILLLSLVVGRFLANVGTVKYNTRLTNNHNEELQEILKLLKGEKND